MEIITARQFQDQLLINQGYNQGKFTMALKIKEISGVEVASELSGFSIEELEE